MKFIKLGLISAGLFFLLLFGISALMPGNIRILRTVSLEASPQQLAPWLHDLRAWKEWNLLTSDSTATDPEFSPDVIRSGNYTIKKISDTTGQVITEWHSRSKTVKSFMQYAAGDDGTTVLQWIFDIELGWYPWDKFASMIFDKQLGIPMEESLHQLEILVTQPS